MFKAVLIIVTIAILSVIVSYIIDRLIATYHKFVDNKSCEDIEQIQKDLDDKLNNNISKFKEEIKYKQKIIQKYSK